MLTTEGHIKMQDGVRLFFEKVGNGPQTIVILNGFTLFDDFKYLQEGRTLVSLDLRNRGRSDFIEDASKLQLGIQQDIDDMDAVRRHFGIQKLNLIGHSYAGLIVILYAIKYSSHVDRIVQLGPTPPNASKQYPANLMNSDATFHEFFAKVAELEKIRASEEPKAFCKKFWSLLRPLYVANPADADKIHWDRCDLPTELNLMNYYLRSILPSMQRVSLTPEEIGVVKSPVLTVHGTKDRSAPYGGGREWALLLPNARLLTIEGVAHAPWIESPDEVLGPIQTFFDGSWPDRAQKVETL